MNGTFILSLDTEIAWGTDPEYLPVYAHCFDHYRVILPRLVALLDTYEIPATWAVVGHLFLKPDDSRSIKKTADKLDWYHGADMIETIRGAKVSHEIGTHTFSHVYTHDATTTREVWNQELQMCVDLHREHGLPLKSLVYPRNQVAFVESFPEFGIIAYRGIEQSWYEHMPMKRPLHLIDRALGLTPPTYDPASLRVGDKLVNLPASQFLMAYDGVRGKIPTSSRVRQAKRGLERAARLGQLYHLWFHPFNLGTSDRMFDALEQILREVRARREAGEIDVMTMAQMAEGILNQSI